MKWENVEGTQVINKKEVAWIFESLYYSVNKIKNKKLKDSFINDLILLKNNCFGTKHINTHDLTCIEPVFERVFKEENKIGDE